MKYYLTLVPIGRPQDRQEYICNTKDIAEQLIKEYQKQHRNEQFLVSLKEKDLNESKIVKE